MTLTTEQKAIINSNGDIKINAVAGSGKTSTLIAYAQSRKPKCKILYLAFNKSVKLEAQKKFAEKGLANVKVETAHSLAFNRVIYNSPYAVKKNGYKTHEIAELLGLQNHGEKHAEYVVANHINKFITYFCNSNKEKISELDYRQVVTDGQALAFVNKYYHYIEEKTRALLDKMNKAEIEITHDFYLKKFQLSKPQLPYDYILFDEAQDASAAMLEIVLNQKAIKVIVGDTHQQIYGWRYVEKTAKLTTNFRFKLTTDFRSKLTSGFRSKLTT